MANEVWSSTLNYLFPPSKKQNSSLSFIDKMDMAIKRLIASFIDKKIFKQRFEFVKIDSETDFSESKEI